MSQLSLMPGRLQDATCHAPGCWQRVRPQICSSSSRPAASFSRHTGSLRQHSSCRGALQARQAAAKEFVEDETFRIEKVSFGSILTPVGASLLAYGFGAYFQLLPGASSAAILLIYGFPMTLLGFALTYAQLSPVPCKTTPEALQQRNTQCTDIQKSVREDVTRYRYGDEQHLDEALNRVFMLGRPKGLPRRLSPKLRAVREEVEDGRYALVLEFESKKREMTDDMWQQRKDKFTSFFGPGVEATISETDLGADVKLLCDGSGAGRGGESQRDVLPPLTPGSKPRTMKK